MGNLPPKQGRLGALVHPHSPTRLFHPPIWEDNSDQQQLRI